MRQTFVVGGHQLSVLEPLEPGCVVRVRGQTTLDHHVLPDIDADHHRVDDDGRRGDHVIRHRVGRAAGVGAVFHFAAHDSYTGMKI